MRGEGNLPCSFDGIFLYMYLGLCYTGYKGYVHVSVPPELSGAEGFSETRAVPLLVYQEGFREGSTQE